ncbi:hypothetical protein CHS0354_038341 [Potamilus streckersoni]|uniref:WW domain-containing protein n=1 Tax=Potamilus streckersoni TaxID=2493646 RepID=A0AAE0S5S0_9BIVA|nr:hypothetical protein CHS0354_038341 [Potamilus streckersoni]
MPLPAALFARLQKRGIVSKEEPKQTPTTEEVEEVFAEDYDDPNKDEPVEDGEEDKDSDDDSISSDILIHEIVSCPNKVNPYHECVDYCKQRWGMCKWEPDVDMIKRRDRMLQKYPLPPGWKEVADPATNRYYYWNTLTDEVSWLSPLHPSANISQPAEKIQALLGTIGKIDKLESDSDDSDEDDDDRRLNRDRSDSDLVSITFPSVQIQ